MSSSFAACLNIAVRSVRDSMIYDSENRHKEAFCQYLSNIIYICGVMKDEAWQRELKDCHTLEALKLFKLSSQCLERAEDLLVSSQASGDEGEHQVETKLSEAQLLLPTAPDVTTMVTANPNTNSAMTTRVATPPPSPNVRKRSGYIDEARRGNSQLLLAYRERMARREKQLKMGHVTKKAGDVTSMNLSLFRKMAENIEIAKARQKSLEKKQEEKQRRLHEEADRRMGPSSQLTTHDQIRKEIYVKVLEFEQESVWLVSFRDQLKTRSNDSALIQTIINKVLETKEHPLTKCLYSYQVEVHNQLISVFDDGNQILARISISETARRNSRVGQESSQDDDTGDAEDVMKPGEKDLRDSEETEPPDYLLEEQDELKYKKILEDVVRNVQSSLEIVHSLFLLTYEEFSSAAGEELCYAMVELTFFKPLWPSLLSLYRIANYKREAKLAKVFKENESCTPQSLHVPERLCLNSERGLASTLPDSQPYQTVVDELKSLVRYGSPLEKLECIVRTNRFIVECVVDHYESQGKPRNTPEAVIGCDDLLPILSYVIVRSQLSQLVSECNAMEDFISEDYLMGEEGYSLTTFQTALAFLETWQVRRQNEESECDENSSQNNL